VKTYVYNWMKHLRRRAAGEEIRAFPLLGDLGRLNHDASTLPAWTTISRLAALHAANRLGSPALDLLVAGSDVFHASNQVRRTPRRSLLTATIHDLTAYLMPEVHTRGNVEADRRFFEGILRRADGLIAVSENTRTDALRLLRLSPERVVTIHSGVADEYFDASPTRRARPYALYVGTIEPRKNLSTLLDAWGSLRADIRGEFDLVVAGPAGWGASSTLERIRAQATYLGYVPEADLPGLTAGAAAFVYPSLYEGFGFPVAQAMAGGVPVITSNLSCLPEVTGGAALLVDPRSPSEIGCAISRVLESVSLRSEMAARGREIAKRYRWACCAEESLNFFRKVAGRELH
jgi:alpha-1,3-rhamnosyl/mannosyltransferase